MQNKEIESKIAFLERHIEEQDKVILKIQTQLDILSSELHSLKTAFEDTQPPQADGHDERPPHY